MVHDKFTKENAENLFVTFFERMPDYMSKEAATEEAFFLANYVCDTVDNALLRFRGHITGREFWGETKRHLSDMMFNSDKNVQASVASKDDSSHAAD